MPLASAATFRPHLVTIILIYPSSFFLHFLSPTSPVRPGLFSWSLPSPATATGHCRLVKPFLADLPFPLPCSPLPIFPLAEPSPHASPTPVRSSHWRCTAVVIGLSSFYCHHSLSVLISSAWYIFLLQSNTILSRVSSLFTFFVSVMFLNEMFTWIKLFSVLFCMAGTIIVSWGDKESEGDAIATNLLLGDVLAIVSAGLYAVYITLIRKKLSEDDEGKSNASMAQFLGFLGLFNLLIFLPIALALNFTKLEQFHMLSWKQFGLVVGKGLLDNVLSDYLWATAVLLTAATVATTGLTIQVPLAAVIDTVTGSAPNMMDYLGAIAIMLGFVGINILSNYSFTSKEDHQEQVDNEGSSNYVS